jgi:hypothetical protein
LLGVTVFTVLPEVVVVVVVEAVLLLPAQQDWLLEPEVVVADPLVQQLLPLAEVFLGPQVAEVLPFTGDTFTNVFVAAS